jgi:hypothetical protein
MQRRYLGAGAVRAVGVGRCRSREVRQGQHPRFSFATEPLVGTRSTINFLRAAHRLKRVRKLLKNVAVIFERARVVWNEQEVQRRGWGGAEVLAQA